jgi:hypothetical protein
LQQELVAAFAFDDEDNDEDGKSPDQKRVEVPESVANPMKRVSGGQVIVLI